VPEAPAIVAGVRARGLAALFLSNTSTQNPAQLRTRLARMGIAAVGEEIYSSATAAARHVAERGFSKAYVVGSPVIHDEVAAHGVGLTERGEEAQALVVGFAPDFDTASLPDGFRPECEFVAANLDVDYPVEGGVRMPGCRQTVDRVAARLGRSYDFVAGKPGTYMLECVERDLGLGAAEIVVVGDNVASDVAMARSAGCRVVLIAAVPPARDTGASAVIASLAHLPTALDALDAS
jgi:HAD superfamily hydrolase (TIGR01450 family)